MRVLPGRWWRRSPRSTRSTPRSTERSTPWSTQWQRSGKEPDYRFSLANERTFLSWIRTSLAVMAAAVAVVQLVPTQHLHGARRALGLLLAAVGLVISASAYGRWAGNERAMRNGAPLPHSPLMVAVSGVLVVVAVIVVAVVIFA